MRCRIIAVLIVGILLAPSVMAQTSGRAGPNCLDRNIGSITNALKVDDGVCIKVNLGNLQPGDVYDVSVSIINDAIDLLFFEQNQILPYDAGQTYQSQFDPVVSTESALGDYSFHWKVPAAGTPKTWYMVLDNLAHDGDNGQGDQGGAQSQIGLTFEKIEESYWTPYHDILAVPSDSHTTLLSGDDLKLDAGTTIVLTAWALEGQGDVYLQTKAMNDLYTTGGIGQLFIADVELQSISNSDSDTWVVPQELEGEELIIIVDNTNNPVGGGIGDTDLRMSVRVELSPVITPIINVDMGETSLGIALNLNATNTPNRSNQIDTLSWDFDSEIDVDSDGVFTNDNDAQGFQVQGIWNTVGQKEVTLTATSQSSQIVTTNYSINVIDIQSPNAVVSSSAESFSGDWKTKINQNTAFSCGDSTDDDKVSKCLWEWGDIYSDTNDSISISWPNIGTYLVNLTVEDESGNSNTVTANVIVDDDSIPSLNNQTIEQLPSTCVEDESIRFSMSAIDAYDQGYQLTYHWDLNPSIDSDNNGNPNDDPDFVGSDVDIEFEDAGRKDIVVTVFDQSGNSDFHAFSINVASSSDPTSVFGIIIVVLFVIAITMAVAMIGYRKWQYGLALELLEGRGLSQAESKQHISMVKERNKVPIFAAASIIAGLESGEKIVTKEERQEQQTQAMYQSIYGSSTQQSPQETSGFAPTINAYAPSSFAPPQAQYSAGTQEAAAAARAMFVEEENQEIIETNTDGLTEIQTTEVISGGIELPPQAKNTLSATEMKETEVNVEEPIKSINCPSCSTIFKIRIPDVEEAVVGCPSCSIDFKLRFE